MADDAKTLNAILGKIDYSFGMTKGGTDASDKSAKDGWAKAKNQKDLKTLAELGLKRKPPIPPAVILGLMSRESNFGMSPALKDGWGDNGNGFGVLQVDKNAHPNPEGSDQGAKGVFSVDHVNQALDIFADIWAKVKKGTGKSWTEAEQLVAAICNYNGGDARTQPKDEASWKKMDSSSTGKDYSSDVWERSSVLADLVWK